MAISIEKENAVSAESKSAFIANMSHEITSVECDYRLFGLLASADDDAEKDITGTCGRKATASFIAGVTDGLDLSKNRESGSLHDFHYSDLM